MATEYCLYNTDSAIVSGYYSTHIAIQFKLFNLRPAVNILMQKAVTLNYLLTYLLTHSMEQSPS